MLLKAAFAFNIDPDDYNFKTVIPDAVRYVEILNQAMQIEDKMMKFYLEAANQSRGLMADIPRVFMKVARKREDVD